MTLRSSGRAALGALTTSGRACGLGVGVGDGVGAGVGLGVGPGGTGGGVGPEAGGGACPWATAPADIDGTAHHAIATARTAAKAAGHLLKVLPYFEGFALMLTLLSLQYILKSMASQSALLF